MRVWSRIALVVVVVVFSASSLVADRLQSSCPLSLADSTAAATDFDQSPHGVFRFGSSVYALRGNVLTTYTVNDVGNLTVARQDYAISTSSPLAARDPNGGVAFSGGFLFVSSEAGLEIYDLRNVRPGGSPGTLLSRTPALHYRKLAVSGNRLAALYPITDYPCYPSGTAGCANAIDIYDISTLSNPRLIGSISSASSSYLGFNDIAFMNGYLIAVGEVGLAAFDITNAASPARIATLAGPGTWLVTNGTDVVGVGRDTTITMVAVRTSSSPFFLRTAIVSLPFYLEIERANDLRFHEEAFYDDATDRLFTLIDEVDPMTLEPARTIAADVFDFSTVPHYEGSAPRIWEDVTMFTDDEVKYDPTVVGPYMYVVGSQTGVQTYGACGTVAGRIEMPSPTLLACGGAEIHGWVTGANKITRVEIFLDDTSLGFADLGGPLRTDVLAKTPVNMWRARVNLDQTSQGTHTLRAVGTDILGTTRQFAAEHLYFPGPGQNCTVPRRRAIR